MELTYIWHDCFVARGEGFAAVFDYWTDPETSGGDPRFLDSLDPARPLYVFVSHHHKDHLNRDIFGWAERFPKIHYVLSKDTVRACRHILSSTSVDSGPKVERGRYTELKPGMTASFGDIKIRAFGSTDIGNSYLVETPEGRIFHAGDLNAWVWTDDSTQQEINKAIGDFKAILNDITAYLETQADRRISICMFPVDSRIGGEYYTGARMFVRAVDVVHFFPMHFGLGDASEQRRHRLDATRFGLYANPDRGDYIALQSPYSSFLSH